ncbi:uncharacterized protein LOC128206548 [Mya arenaria]|uniref:uncharacterized protein LOC128206548 n=1 Tax=Mya arenaria TaxID=6604 RepID=UPI0022E901F4|nr:uncharacterized protein LOC128206548 [Mya arenaria]
MTRVHKNIGRKHVQAEFSCRHCNSQFLNYEQLFQHVIKNHPLQEQRGGRRASKHRLVDVNEIPRHSIVNNRTAFAPDTVGSSLANGYTDMLDSTNDLNQSQQNDDPPDLDNNESSDEDEPVNNQVDESALGNRVINRLIHPIGNERYDLLTFFGNRRDQVRSFLHSRARQLRGIKWSLCVQVEMERIEEGEVTSAQPYFRSNTYITLSVDDWNEHDLNEAIQKMFASLEEFIRRGSGCYVKKVLKLEIHTVGYKPVSGSSYLPLPKSLAYSRSLLNIENDDDKCFLYCLLASMHHVTIQPEQVEHYLPYKQEIDMLGINYPVKLADIRKVERRNENISINVFTYEKETIVPLRITEHTRRPHHVNLLWLTKGDISHYYLITDLNKFLSRTKNSHIRRHFCPYCLHGFLKETSLKEHQKLCARNGAQRVNLPTPGDNDILNFKDYEKTLKAPFIVYADFETVNKKLPTCASNPKHSSTTQNTKLEVCSFGYKVVCEDNRYTKPTVVYTGEDAGSKMIECLLKEEKQIREILSHIKPMDISEKEREDIISKANYCCICKKAFTFYDRVYNRIVLHHNHLTSELIGPACNDPCNLNCRQVKFIPVMFHNLKNFDAHIICQNIGKFKSYKLSCIAQTTEKYVSFSLPHLRFIDSFQFLPTSLETLVDNLAQDGLEAFPHLLSETKDESEAQLLLRKGVYPYEYMDCMSKFDEVKLPAKEEFYSTIKKEHKSEEDYQHAKTVFERFNMTSLREYQELYLRMDCVLLCEVFESFRTLCLKQYELDPCHFYTSPGLSWSACLKMSEVQLELLTDIDQVLMIEAGIRGGISQISHRHAKANNPYLQDYDTSLPTTYLQYLDANNLYGWAMNQPLPVGQFEFMSESDMGSFNIMTIPEAGDTGYILEVSLEYPKNLHDIHNCFPLAPERRTISNEELSPYARGLLKTLHGLTEEDPLPNRGKVDKLLTTLQNKNHYILHYRNLQLYLSLGMKLKGIYKILKFKQETWMKKYIDHNTAMRQKATSTFQKNFYKLMNVSVFGKTMENVRRYKAIEIIHTKKRLDKVTAKPTYKDTTILNEDLVAVELYKSTVNLVKPIYCGMSILDLSKCLMYDFWYNYIKQKYPTAKMLMTDTDSIFWLSQTDDIYRDMKSSMCHFDTSDYPRDHFLWSNSNKKVLGKMKDETNGQPISEFVGLRSKMYSFLCNDKEEKRAKGVAKVSVKKELKHEHYKNTLFNETSMISSMTALRSHQHELYGETIQKRALSAFDDKRYLTDSVNSYAYGHYKITAKNTSKDVNQCQDELPFSIVPANEFVMHSAHDIEQSFHLDGFKITPCKKVDVY